MSKMPVFFVGHGSPMNAISDNAFTQSVSRMGSGLSERPAAVLVVSAHWLTDGIAVASAPKPETIYDFGGFPDELYQVKYDPPGSPEFAREVARLAPKVKEDPRWGLDHGAWTVLKHMFPKADIPAFQLSVDYYRPMEWHFELAKALAPLREQGVLIVGSGNIVHNLRYFFDSEADAPFNWATEFDAWVRGRIAERDFKSLLKYEKQGKAARLSVPTPDHYIPMLYALALAGNDERIEYTYEEVIASISMRCFAIGG
jgi:4,5-DOPA dioxygenase extradiol